MFRTLLQWLRGLFLALNLVGPLHAQAPEKDKDKDAEKGRRGAVPEYALAFLATALVLVVVCTPSRKD